MKKYRYIFFLSLPLFTLWFCTSSSSVKEKEINVTKASKDIRVMNKQVAVLELFTSQGCSSCPSADRLLDKLSDVENVIALSFHVDYWDRLGWKDPYSSKEYTKRQYNYASVLNSQVYTPQLVINGESEMVGSDSKKIDNTLKAAWSMATNTSISIDNFSLVNGKANIHYTIKGITNRSMLNIALVEKKTTTAIRAGENGGATLKGTNVVRDFKTISNATDGANTYSLEVPKDVEGKNMAVVIFIQQKDNKIIAADKASPSL
ncbi:MAG: DUF1223 domain-containing protein [Ginsengibacter sp.]